MKVMTEEEKERRTEAVNRNFFYPVEKVRDTEIEKSDAYKIVNANTGQKISSVSGRYALVPNRQIFQPFIDRLGIENLSKAYSLNAGKTYYFEFKTGRTLDIGGSGDLVNERLVVQNSYDKTRSFSFTFGAFRLVCSNGLFYPVSECVHFKKIHVGDISIDALTTAALANYERNDFGMWRAMASVPLTLDQQIQLVDQWQPFEPDEEKPSYKGNNALNANVKRYAQYKIEKEESLDNQRNAWGLFNQMNWALRRNIGDKDFSKKILGDRRSIEYIKSKVL